MTFWHAAAILACLLGMACKEVMVTAPLVVLLYDRTFLAGSFGAALRRRGAFYLGLAATWGLLLYLTFSTGLIARQTEIGAPDPWSYALSQPGVILNYLRLALWPSPLCLDYAWPVAKGPSEILPGAIVVGALAAATFWGLLKRSGWGFLGAWFLLILAPTSSMLPLQQLAFEHRMYLPLAAIIVLAVAGSYAVWDRLFPRERGHLARFMRPRRPRSQLRWAAPAAAWGAVVIALACATIARNTDYQSLLTIWEDTVAKRPGNAFAHYNLGTVLSALGSTAEANAHYREALRLKPGYVEPRNNLGTSLAAQGYVEEAIEQFRKALRFKPDVAAIHGNLAHALAGLGKTEEAVAHYREALRLDGDYFVAHYNLANLLADSGKTEEAIEHFNRAVHLKPDYAEARNNLGYVLAKLGRVQEAIKDWQESVRLKPDYAEAHYNLATALHRIGNTEEAVEHYEEVVRQLPEAIVPLNNLAWLLATSEPSRGGDPARAVEVAEWARQLSSGRESAQCLDTLAVAYAAAGRFADAIGRAEEALRLAESSEQRALAENIRARIELYRAGRPYREAAPGTRPAE